MEDFLFENGRRIRAAEVIPSRYMNATEEASKHALLYHAPSGSPGGIGYDDDVARRFAGKLAQSFAEPSVNAMSNEEWDSYFKAKPEESARLQEFLKLALVGSTDA